jgi:tRNA modification GTPase
VLPAADPQNHHLVLVRTKSDLAHGCEEEPLAEVASAFDATDSAETSAESGAGIRSLVDTIGGVLSRRLGAPDFDAPVLTQARHRFAVERALRELQAFRHAWREETLPATIAAVHLRAAAGALEELIGKVDVEDILDEVFRRFCIGK